MTGLDKQIEAYERNRDTLELNYLGRWVVFYDEELAGDHQTFEEAANFAVASFGRGPYLIRQVGASELFTPPASVLFRPQYA